VGFVVDEVALGQIIFRVLLFSPVTIIPPLLHIHSCIIWGMDNRPVSCCSSTETQSHPTATINNKTLEKVKKRSRTKQMASAPTSNPDSVQEVLSERHFNPFSEVKGETELRFDGGDGLQLLEYHEIKKGHK
jgi:hypothetical protein